MVLYVQFWWVFYGNKNPIVYAFPKLPYWNGTEMCCLSLLALLATFWYPELRGSIVSASEVHHIYAKTSCGAGRLDNELVSPRWNSQQGPTGKQQRATGATAGYNWEPRLRESLLCVTSGVEIKISFHSPATRSLRVFIGKKTPMCHYTHATIIGAGP